MKSTKKESILKVTKLIMNRSKTKTNALKVTNTKFILYFINFDVARNTHKFAYETRKIFVITMYCVKFEINKNNKNRNHHNEINTDTSSSNDVLLTEGHQVVALVPLMLSNFFRCYWFRRFCCCFLCHANQVKAARRGVHNTTDRRSNQRPNMNMSRRIFWLILQQSVDVIL